MDGLKVVHATEAPLGGVVSYLQELLNYQISDDRIAWVGVITPEINVSALSSVKHPKITLRSFAHRRGSVRGLIALARETLHLVQMTQPDVLHIHSTFAGAILRLCVPFMRSKTRVIYCPHGWAFSREAGFFVKKAISFVEKLLSRVTDATICISSFERDEAAKVGIKSKCIVIPNGIKLTELVREREPRDFSCDGRKRTVLFVGRFDRQKGFDIFLDVMSRLEGTADGIAVGSYLVSKERPMAVLPNVKILGWRPREELTQLYQEADLLLVPSRWEGFGLIAIEAMRAHLPVFASCVGGLKEIIIDGVTGRLFDLKHREQIKDIIEDITAEQLSAFGKNGYTRYSEKYTASAMGAKVTELYDLLKNSVGDGSPDVVSMRRT